MSLFDRIKRARAKADKLSKKSKKAESKGKEGKAARLEERSEKKSGKADKLSKKFIKKHAKPSSFMMGASFGIAGDPKPSFKKAGFKGGASETMQKAAKELTFGSTFGTGETMQDTGDKPLIRPKKSGPKDTSYKEKSAPYHGKVDKDGNPPR